ncbi:YIP1 family protein [Staphylococcus warneri]|uniref:YIP1 family protein n=1 Tax=Staphylococcus warneri TaxID=1292 RepID=UPI000F71164D|nr:YIP1 family protein [Staphylococcus warneri]VED30037.1 Yip1 domain [Staphylococcus warneri]
MEQTNTTQPEASQSNLPFVDHFRKIRQNPKWLVKLIIFIVLAIIMSFMLSKLQLTPDTMKENGINNSNKTTVMTITIISGIFGILFSSVIAFLIFLVISKIFKSDVKTSSLISATLSYSIIINIWTLIVSAIHLLFGIDFFDYKLDSLNIFNKGNDYLANFNLTNLLKAFLTGVLYYATSHLSKKASIILAVVALVLIIGSGLIGAGMQDSMQSLSGM